MKCIAEVPARDVREVLERIRESNCPTIANDTLMYMKQLFRHAIKLDLTLNNPAAAFTVDDAECRQTALYWTISFNQLAAHRSS
ncbi:phage integrase central domain-containing protein [Thiopseudomonas alkaliphila]|uniref:phage integrase central domain-containing protein n=1 Tax=Thiopseudomonas alkaliphila TaxID=1697053 RepID=UPI0039E0A934